MRPDDAFRIISQDVADAVVGWLAALLLFPVILPEVFAAFVQWVRS